MGGHLNGDESTAPKMTWDDFGNSRHQTGKYGKSLLDSYASAKSNPKGLLRTRDARISSMTLTQASNYIENYKGNVETIGSLMEGLSRKNGIVGRTINYFTSLPTYNYSIYLDVKSKDNFNVDVSLEDYLAGAEYAEKYNIKFFAPFFIRQALIYGVAYFYEISDNSGVAYLQFPVGMCVVSSMENGVYRWMIDTSKVSTQLLAMDGFPTEIKRAMESTDRTGNRWVDGKYYILSDKAFAICFDPSVITNGGVAISELASLIADSINLDKARDNVEIKDDIDTVRIIHGKIPMDKEGNPKMTPSQVEVWEAALQAGLPNGIAGVVTPFDLTNVNLQGSANNRAYDTVNDAQGQMFYSTGTTPAIFGQETKASNIVNISIQKDLSWIYTRVFPALQNYYNFTFSKMKSAGGSTWKMRFLNQSLFTMDRDIQRIKDAVTLGGSRTDYLAALGMSPIEIYSKLYVEQNSLNIDSLMAPKATSFTMSGKTTQAITERSVGRPLGEEPVDESEVVQDNQ